MPKYKEKNEKNQWWDGVTWRNLGEADSKTSIQNFYRMQTYDEEDRRNSTNRDGVFKCPRCYKKHFVPTNYDYLCNGCVVGLLTHPKATEKMLAGIKHWRSIATDWENPEVKARFEERAKLEKEKADNPDAPMLEEPDLTQMVDSMMNFWCTDEFND